MFKSLLFLSVFSNQNLAILISLLSFDQLNKSFLKIVVFIIELVTFRSFASNSSKLNYILPCFNKSNREACQTHFSTEWKTKEFNPIININVLGSLVQKCNFCVSYMRLPIVIPPHFIIGNPQRFIKCLKLLPTL